MIAEMPAGRPDEPGTGLEDVDWKVLVYTDLYRIEPDEDMGRHSMKSSST